MTKGKLRNLKMNGNSTFLQNQWVKEKKITRESKYLEINRKTEEEHTET